MASSFTWLAFSESERQQAMQVLDLFREKSTLDELGFAPIRDAFADHFFPGTSTIQTRARYFLFVPWILKRLEQQRFAGTEFLTRVRNRESKLIHALLAGDPDQNGIIGRDAMQALKRMPSAVYWRGLHLWGIRLFHGSLEQLAKQVGQQDHQSSHRVTTDDGDPVDSASTVWFQGLPKEPANMLEKAVFVLTREEAEFLTGRICTHHPKSILASVLVRAKNEIDSEFVWDPKLQPLLSTDQQTAVEFSRLFALCAWGASLLYTRMVAKLKDPEHKLVDAVTHQLIAWRDILCREATIMHGWDLAAFWAFLKNIDCRPTGPTRKFAASWIDISLRAADGGAVWEDSDVQKLVATRELSLKKQRARLRPENYRGRDRWQGDVTVRPMDYRWGPTRNILNDILSAANQPFENAEGVENA